MIKLLTNAQMREADAYTIGQLNIPSEELMRRAGLAVCEEVEKIARDKLVTVVCGTGNNGGDGYVLAEALKNRGIAVRVYAIDGKLSPDCEREKMRYGGIYASTIDGEVIVDCIFGTGLARKVEGRFADAINAINSSGATVISVDIPSGLNGDNGEVMGCAVKSDITVAIAAVKLGCVLGDGLDYCGKIIRKDIGITCPAGNYACAYEDGDVAPFYPKRKRNSHKGTFGAANIVAGSEKYMGAAALASHAALKSGCGYVKLSTCDKVKTALAARFPQVIYLDDTDLTSDAIAVGMGCGVSKELYAKITHILNNYDGSLIIDADGLNTLAKFGVDALKNKKCKVLITPHIKEFARLTGKTVAEIVADSVNCAKAFAREYSVTVLLKNSASVICDGERTVVNLKGNSALAKGGSGDMLSGYLAGSVARGLNLFDGAVCAAYTIGMSAEISSEQKTEYCATANDVIKNLHFSVKRLTDTERYGNIKPLKGSSCKSGIVITGD